MLQTLIIKGFEAFFVLHKKLYRQYLQGLVHILGEDKPRELVKHNLLKLNTADIEYVLEKYKALDVAIKKKYILSMLYSAPMERSAHYINLANENWENELKKNKQK